MRRANVIVSYTLVSPRGKLREKWHTVRWTGKKWERIRGYIEHDEYSTVEYADIYEGDVLVTVNYHHGITDVSLVTGVYTEPLPFKTQNDVLIVTIDGKHVEFPMPPLSAVSQKNIKSGRYVVLAMTRGGVDIISRHHSYRDAVSAAKSFRPTSDHRSGAWVSTVTRAPLFSPISDEDIEQE